MPRIVLILPTATYKAEDFLAAANELALDVTVGSDELPSFARDMGLDFVLIDRDRPEWSAAQIETLASQTTIDAVVAADDGGVLMAAIASSRLGLRYSEPEGVARTRNKAMMRRSLDGEVRQPEFMVLGPSDDVSEALQRVGLPAVIKPLSLSGSRGVIRIDDIDEAEVAIDRIRKVLVVAGSDPNEALLVEEFIPGPELAIEGVMSDGELQLLAVFDKPDPLDGPYFEESIYVTPSRMHPEVQLEARDVTERAARHLGIREGPIHAEVRVDGGNVYFLELAARSIGGLCGRALRFGMMGTSLENLLLRSSLGMPVERLVREEVSSGVLMLPIERSGILTAVRGVDAALAITGINDVRVSIPIGARVTPVPEGDRYLGFAFARGERPDEVEKALREVRETLEIVIE